MELHGPVDLLERVSVFGRQIVVACQGVPHHEIIKDRLVVPPQYVIDDIRLSLVLFLYLLLSLLETDGALGPGLNILLLSIPNNNVLLLVLEQSIEGTVETAPGEVDKLLPPILQTFVVIDLQHPIVPLRTQQLLDRDVENTLSHLFR